MSVSHLVDNDESGVDEHQVVFLQRQVVGLLQSKEHRSQQGDLCGAKQSEHEENIRSYQM